jgi:hypothetical protein
LNQRLSSTSVRRGRIVRTSRLDLAFLEKSKLLA